MNESPGGASGGGGAAGSTILVRVTVQEQNLQVRGSTSSRAPTAISMTFAVTEVSFVDFCCDTEMPFVRLESDVLDCKADRLGAAGARSLRVFLASCPLYCDSCPFR